MNNNNIFSVNKYFFMKKKIFKFMKRAKNHPSRKKLDISNENIIFHQPSTLRQNNENSYKNKKIATAILTHTNFFPKKLDNKENIINFSNLLKNQNKSLSKKNSFISKNKKNSSVNKNSLSKKVINEKSHLKSNFQLKNNISNKIKEIKVNKKTANKNNIHRKNIISSEINKISNPLYNNSNPNFYKNFKGSFTTRSSKNDSIKFININVDVKKIIYIQKWWKYLYKVIKIQQQFRAHILHKNVKLLIKTQKFVKILKYFFYSKISKLFENKSININESINSSLMTINNNCNKNFIPFISNIRKKKIKSTKNSERLFSPLQYANFIEDNNKKQKINIQTCTKKENSSISIINNCNNSLENIKNSNNSMSNIHNKYRKLTSRIPNVKKSTNLNTKSNNKSFLNEENINTYNIINEIYNRIKEYYNTFNNSTLVNNKENDHNNFHKSILSSSTNFYSNKNLKKINSNHNSNRLSKKIISNVNNNRNTHKPKKKVSMKNLIHSNNFNNIIKKNETIPYYSNINKGINIVTDNSNATYLQNNNLNNTVNTLQTNNNSKSISNITPSNESANTLKQTKNNMNYSLEMKFEPVKYLIKCKRYFTYWHSFVTKKKLLRKLRSIYLLTKKLKKNCFIFFYAKLQSFVIYKHKFINKYFNRFKEIVEKAKIVDLLRNSKNIQNSSSYYSNNGNKTLNMILNNLNKTKNNGPIKKSYVTSHSMIDLQLTETSLSNNFEINSVKSVKINKIISNKINILSFIINMIFNLNNKHLLKKYLNKWYNDINNFNYTTSQKVKNIDSKIIKFSRSPLNNENHVKFFHKIKHNNEESRQNYGYKNCNRDNNYNSLFSSIYTENDFTNRNYSNASTIQINNNNSYGNKIIYQKKLLKANIENSLANSNTLTNFFSSKNFFEQNELSNKRKVNMIEEKEINFSPCLTKKSHGYTNLNANNSNDNIFYNIEGSVRKSNFYDMNKMNKFLIKRMSEGDEFVEYLGKSHSQDYRKNRNNIYEN